MRKAKKFSRNINLAVCGIATLVLGAVIFGAGVMGQSRVRQTAQWPSVTGRVVSSKVDTSVSRFGRITKIQPVARVVYAYSVNGVKYECDRRRVVPMFHTANGTPEEIVARYQVGTIVDVYFDPSDPQDALLSPLAENGADKLISSLFYVAMPVIVIGLVLLVIGGPELFVTVWAALPDSLTALHALKAYSFDYSFGKPSPTGATPIKRTATCTSEANQPAKCKPPRKTYWLVRVAAVALGVFMFPVGVLLLAVCATMPAGEHGITIHVVTLAIFGIVTMFGAWLLWLGFKKPRGEEVPKSFPR